MNKKLLLLLPILMILSCNKRQKESANLADFEGFVSQYNKDNETWLKLSIADNRKKLEKFKESKENNLKQDQLLLQKIKKQERRLQLGEYFYFGEEEDLPKNLVWESGMNEPEIGSPQAKKGGVFRDFLSKFPATFRRVGPNSNHSFRASMYDYIEIPLVTVHPLTQNFIPGTAKEWAIGEDKRTVFFRLDPKAKYTNGDVVKAVDYMWGVYVRVSNNVTAAFFNQYYREQYERIAIYGDSVVAVTLPNQKPISPYFASITPASPRFYREYGPDYKKRYQWRVEPTTGAYRVNEKDVVIGSSITLTRVKDWWAKDHKYYRNMYNVDKIKYMVVAEMSKAFELFRAGQLDRMYLGIPEYWYDKMDVPEYFNGYIEKTQFYTVYPRVPRGLYLNVHKAPLNDLNIRQGFAHSLDFNKVNIVNERGDAERLQQFSEGFGDFTNPNVKARSYSPSKSREYFAAAGYKKKDAEGYLINAQGKRLEIEISWAKSPYWDTCMDILEQSAKKCGLKIKLDSLEDNIFFKKGLDKRHQALLWGWGSSPPFPRYHQFFHSSNAFDSKGNPKSQTNNLNLFKNKRMDELTEIVRSAKTRQELKKAAEEVQQIVRDQAIFIPALKKSYKRIGYWRWLCWPQTKSMEFCAPQVYLPTESYLYWIDEEKKKETLKAKKSGEVFEERNNVFDKYRHGLVPVEKTKNRKADEIE